MRLIVTDNSTAARTIADRLAQGKARRSSVHRVEVFDVHDDAGDARVIGLGGLLFTPTGDPPAWQPARRAPANALRLLARSADALLLALDDPLMAVQARDVACAERPELLRRARCGRPPFTRLRHPDDLAAQARAAEMEMDALVAAYIATVDPALDRRALAALGGIARDPARPHDPAALWTLAERGYAVGDPPWLTPAGQLVIEGVDRSLLAPRFTGECDAWVDAVRRGSLTRDAAVDRARRALAPLERPARPDGLGAGRLIGPCPECGEWMGGATGRLTCMGCGLAYRLPRQVEALAVPGARCDACDAPLILPVVRGRRDEARCPDATGCPTRLGSPGGR